MQNNSDFLLYHHLGFGDHIAMNGMVRFFYKEKKFNTFFLFSKKNNANNVKFMFRDLKKLIIIEVSNDNEALKKFNQFDGDKIKNMGAPNFDIFGDAVFYTNLNLSPDIRFNHFFVERDLEREKKVYEELTKNIDGNYVFIHDDIKRGYKIDIERHNITLPIIYADIKYNFFDLIYTMEQSKKLYMITSSFVSYLIHSKTNLDVSVDDKARKIGFKKYLLDSGLKIV